MAGEATQSSFIHGTKWEHVNSILQKGLSCRGEDNPDGNRGRQFIHGCLFLPGDLRIRSGIRHDAEVLIFVSVKGLLTAGMRIWRSANDIILTSGDAGRIHPACIIQMVGLQGVGFVGKVWHNP